MVPAPVRHSPNETLPSERLSTRGIDFLIAGGEGVGWGHLSRCAVLASEARRRGWEVRAFLRGDAAAAKQWQSLTGSEISGAWAAWHAGWAQRVVVLDFPKDRRDGAYDPKGEWLDRLERHGQQVMLIDDRRRHAAVEWTVLPALHHGLSAQIRHEPAEKEIVPSTPLDSTAGLSRPLNQTARGQLMLGPSYALLGRAHLARSPIPLNTRHRILLSMGGSDPHSFTPRIARALSIALASASLRSASYCVDVVLGAGFEDPKGLEAQAIQDLGFQVHRAVSAEKMAELMHRARLALIGFGVSLSELAWHNTPFLTVPHHDTDRAPARDLAANGIGRLLASGSELDQNQMVNRIAAALADHNWQRTSSALANTALEGGNGADRILSRLEDDLAKRMLVDNQTQRSTPLQAANTRAQARDSRGEVTAL